MRGAAGLRLARDHATTAEFNVVGVRAKRQQGRQLRS
jgi:hypothetical protein